GTPLSLTVTARDAHENVATDYAGTVAFTTGVADPTKTLPANYHFTTGSGGDNGVHTFAATLRTASPTQSLAATDTSYSSITGEVSIAVNPADANHLVVTYPNTDAGVSNPLSVTATDPYGNTDTNFADTVNFSSSDSSAQAGSGLPANGQSLSSGVGSFTASSEEHTSELMSRSHVVRLVI